jgi:hypothetical protein
MDTYLVVDLFAPTHVVSTDNHTDALIALYALRGLYPVEPFVLINPAGQVEDI